MVGIKMDMPKSCEECYFFKTKRESCYGKSIYCREYKTITRCILQNNKEVKINKNENIRHSNCPLVELIGNTDNMD